MKISLPYRFGVTVAAALTAVGVSCTDFLEQPEQSGLTPDVVFSDFNTAEEVLAGAYALMPTGIVDHDNSNGPWGFGVLIYTGNLSNMSDESDTYANDAASGCVDRIYQKGGLTPTTAMAYREDKWTYYFQAIRNCYLYLENIDKATKNATPELIARRKAEAKVLLALHNFEVFKRFGGLPWVPGFVSVDDRDAIRPRLSVEESIEKIVGFLDEAIAEGNLPMRSDDVDFGRANRANALMLKARVLLYAASPLYNTVVFPSYGRQELVRYEDISDGAVQKRWERARDAASTAIELCNAAGYYLIGESMGSVDPTDEKNRNGENFKSACDLITLPSQGNTEVVWSVRNEKSGNVYGIQFFAPYQKWNSYQTSCTYLPLQNLVDQFELTDGEMQPENQLSSANPYANLDARFHRSILYHGSVLDRDVSVPRTIDFTPGGDNYPGENSYNFTSYSQRKFLNDQYLSTQISELHNIFWPFMRMADLYLIMAEASNEAGDISTALLWLNKVRQRAGQPKLEQIQRWLTGPKDKAYLRSCIKNERNVELAFENQRYFDLKRWLMGHNQPNYRGVGKGSIGGQMYAVSVTGTASSPTFTRVPFEMRTFTDKFYHYPIPQDDINKSGGILVQNPGW